MVRFLSLFFALLPAVAISEAPEGQKLFRLHCAACHGAEARGDGPMGEVLARAPSDLSLLAQANAGQFPRARIIATIDGRDRLPAHGGPMPVYGWFFDAPGRDGNDQKTTPSEIMEIVNWLETIQR